MHISLLVLCWIQRKELWKNGKVFERIEKKLSVKPFFLKRIRNVLTGMISKPYNSKKCQLSQTSEKEVPKKSARMLESMIEAKGSKRGSYKNLGSKKYQNQNQGKSS